MSNHLCPAFHLSVWIHWFRKTPFSGFLLFWVPFNLSWLLSFLLFGMFSLLSIQIHHVLVDTPDATSRNLLPVPLRLCPHKLLHKQNVVLYKVTEYCPMLVRMSLCICLLIVLYKDTMVGCAFQSLCLGPCKQSTEHGDASPTGSPAPGFTVIPCVGHSTLEDRKANSSAIKRGVPKVRTGSSFTLIIGKSAEQRFLYKILSRKTRLF